MTDQELVSHLRIWQAVDEDDAIHGLAADRIEALNALLSEAFQLGKEMAEATDAVVASVERLTDDNVKLITENARMRETLQCAWEQWGDDYLWKKWDLGEWPA